jgi:phospholipid/cholesterol/gamma-HCH transport system ATP-binding protein
MAHAAPILELSQVRSGNLLGVGTETELNFVLQVGELALIDARDTELAAGFADLCCGLDLPPKGAVNFLDRDWSKQPQELAAALRGRIGRVLAVPGWLRFLDATANILLEQLYHTRRDADSIRSEASALARHFGLPGIPAGPIASLSRGDLVRAGFVRAFLGNPKLVILESPVQGLYPDMVPPLLNQIAVIRDLGGAAIWLTRSRLVWDNRSFPATQRLRLGRHGLSAVRAAA